MFTGIVEAVGEVAALEPGRGVVRVAVRAPGLAAETRLGDSVAVSGTCLTIAEEDGSLLLFDAVPETLARTSLGDLEVGSRVNLERSLRADARLDGHIVQGHVDETGRVRSLRRERADVRLFVSTSEAFADLLVEKGSVAVEGVSLTLVGVEPGGFDVALVPHTLAVTTLGELAPGRRVNLEADVLGKYVKRYLERVAAGRGPVAGA
ncbi:MAG TPA: riboflavin synthase [Longimicrobiales bacterium]|nr:riboflavin synthase [Longimicrobiales bacterium]